MRTRRSTAGSVGRAVRVLAWASTAFLLLVPTRAPAPELDLSYCSDASRLLAAQSCRRDDARCIESIARPSGCAVLVPTPEERQACRRVDAARAEGRTPDAGDVRRCESGRSAR